MNPWYHARFFWFCQLAGRNGPDPHTPTMSILLRTSAWKPHLPRRAWSSPRPFLLAFSFHYFSRFPNLPPLHLAFRGCCWKNRQCSFFVRDFGKSAALADMDTFFADGAISWSSLGVSGQLVRALCSAGLDRPSLIQAACIPSILAGNDVVVAAETGSGKTHGYLAPLIHHLCSRPNECINADAMKPPHRFSIVLCPNVTLCEQVVRMANRLCGDDGQPLVRVASVCGLQGWPIKKQDIIVSTPAALLNHISAVGSGKSHRSNFARAVKLVVFDEADLLISGSFQKQVIRLIDMFRFDEKELFEIKRYENLMKTDPDAPSHFVSKHEEDVKSQVILGSKEIAQVEDSLGSNRGYGQRKPRRSKKYYERSKQYIFVAATLPTNGKRTAGAILDKMFPSATWISGAFLHHHNVRSEQKWVEITLDTQADALIEAVNHGLKSKIINSINGVSRTMVFANTVAAVESVAKILKNSGIECFCYHSDHSLEDRAEILTTFQNKGGVLVCTDAASRGLDIPNVFHVIQAEFAPSAVDFLHRTGRTARAGQHGLVTNLYDESSRDLASAVRNTEELGLPLEKAFSRNRSFRKRIRKRMKSGLNLGAANC